MPTAGVIIHLKTWPEPFQAMWDGLKTAEFRRNDWKFKLGDHLLLHEYDPDRVFSGRMILFEVTHITTGFGIPESHVMLSGKIHWKANNEVEACPPSTTSSPSATPAPTHRDSPLLG
jgi:hypothetical protein